MATQLAHREDIHREDIHREDIHREDIHKEDIHREDIHKGCPYRHIVSEKSMTLISPRPSRVSAARCRITGTNSLSQQSDDRLPNQKELFYAYLPASRQASARRDLDRCR